MEKERMVNGLILTAQENQFWGSIQPPLDIAKTLTAIPIYQQNWLSGIENIESEFNQFLPAKVDPLIDTNVLVNKYLIYVQHASHLAIFNKNRTPYIQEHIYKEFKKANDDGIICVYASVLLYLLLKRLPIEYSLSFIQGFYRITFPTDSLQCRSTCLLINQ